MSGRRYFMYGCVVYALAAVMFMLASEQCKAADPWSADDKARQFGYFALHAADWSQTLYIAENPHLHTEGNPILGVHPSRGDVNRYFMATGLLHLAASHYLPARYRAAWQWFTIGLEFGAASHNVRAGVGFAF